jgi:hypothetical protein
MRAFCKRAANYASANCQEGDVAATGTDGARVAIENRSRHTSRNSRAIARLTILIEWSCGKNVPSIDGE